MVAKAKLRDSLQKRKNTTCYSFGAPNNQGTFAKKGGFALSFKEWARFGSAERRKKGLTNKGNLRIDAKGYGIKGLFFSVNSLFSDMSCSISHMCSLQRNQMCFAVSFFT